MYRLIPNRYLFLVLAWLVLGILYIVVKAHEIFGTGERWSSVPAWAWVALNLLLLNPIWRFFWKVIPPLRRWFPDLNGSWDVKLESNWARHKQVIAAAKSEIPAIDIQTCPEEELAPLTPISLRAEIRQTWWSFEMRLTNPRTDSPLKRSDVIILEPFAGKGLRPPTVCYFYKQENATDNVSDDNEFFGAARLTYDADCDRLEGVAWTARMWRRAMNTAAAISFTRA